MLFSSIDNWYCSVLHSIHEFNAINFKQCHSTLFYKFIDISRCNAKTISIVFNGLKCRNIYLLAFHQYKYRKIFDSCKLSTIILFIK